MKKIIVLFVALASVSYSCAQKSTSAPNYKVSRESVSSTLQFLSSNELKGRETGTEGAEMAAKYLEDIFIKNNVKPYFASYRDTLSNFPKPAYNVIGVIEGNDPAFKDEYIIISAHYDHVGMAAKPVNGDNIFNGANDNATGSTTVAELVNYFAKTKFNKRSILFCFFSGDEKGLLGSYHLAKKLKEQNFNLYTVVNFEMTGVPLGTGTEQQAFITGYGRSNMAEKLNEYAGKKLIGSNEFEMKYQLFRASDNYPFFLEFNLPSHTISTTEMTTFPYYHHVDDEYEQMDTEHMASFIQQMIPVVQKMVNAPTQEIVLKQ